MKMFLKKTPLTRMILFLAGDYDPVITISLPLIPFQVRLECPGAHCWVCGASMR